MNRTRKAPNLTPAGWNNTPADDAGRQANNELTTAVHQAHTTVGAAIDDIEWPTTQRQRALLRAKLAEKMRADKAVTRIIWEAKRAAAVGTSKDA